MTPEEKEQGWRYIEACMLEASKVAKNIKDAQADIKALELVMFNEAKRLQEYTKRAADMADKIKGRNPVKGTKVPKLKLVKDDD